MESLAALLPWKNVKEKKKQKELQEEQNRNKSSLSPGGDDSSSPNSRSHSPLHDTAKRQAAERLKHQKRLEASESGVVDCVWPIWFVAFCLVAVVSFTPLFSSFMAIYVVRQRVDNLIPKNLNVTAVDAAFVFESTLGKPIRQSASEIATGLYNRLQRDEWARRERAISDMRAWGPVYGIQKYSLPTMTSNQKKFIDDLCSSWREQIEDPANVDNLRRRSGSKRRNTRKALPYCKVNHVTPYCRWTNETQDYESIPKELRKLFPEYYRNSSSDNNNDNEDEINVYQQQNQDDSASDHYLDHSHDAVNDDVELQNIYSAIDSIVRRSNIGEDFNGNGFVLLWGVDMNESGGMTSATRPSIVSELEEYSHYTGSHGLPFLCGWKHSGLKTARTAYSVTDKKKVFANFSFLNEGNVPWSNQQVADSCNLMCSTSYFSIFNISPPTSAEPQCNCQKPRNLGPNGTKLPEFYDKANYDNSVTVLRPTPWTDVPKTRPNPFPTTADQNTPPQVHLPEKHKTLTLPWSVANYTNYMWVDSTQTFDTYSLGLNSSQRELLLEALRMAASNHVNEHSGWLAYNLTFNQTFASIVNTPPQLSYWPNMMNAYTARSTLLDTDLAASAFAARHVKAPVFDKSSKRTFNCPVSRWFYSLERSPAPCGDERGFVADALTLYRVTPVKVRRQAIDAVGDFQESPVRLANVVVGRRIPIGLLQKLLWPLARQSAFQFSLVDATTMTEVTCVDGSNDAASSVFTGTTGKVRAVWSLIWNTLAVYLPGGYVPLSWRFPFSSFVMNEDHNHDWLSEELSGAATRPGRWGPMPPSAQCKKSLSAQTLDVLSGRKTTSTPFVDAETRIPLTSIEDFTDAPRVVFAEAYMYAIPIQFEQRDLNSRTFNPTDDLERTSCDNYALDEEEDYAWNRDPSRPSLFSQEHVGAPTTRSDASSSSSSSTTSSGSSSSNTAGDSSSTSSSDIATEDVKCGSGTNDMTTQMLNRIQNSMRIESEPNPEQVYLTTSSNSPSPEPTSEAFRTQKKNKRNLYIFVSLQSRDLLELVLESRSQVVVTSAVCAFIIVIALFIIVRGLTGPLKQLRRVLHSCSELNWDHFSKFNGSVIAEVLEVQYAMSYITVKMQSFARFLPPGLKQFGEAAQRSVRIDAKNRRIFSTLEDFGSSSSDDDDHGSTAERDQLNGYRVVDGTSGLVEHKIFADANHDDMEDDLDYANAVDENEMKELEFSGRSTNYARQLSYSLMGPSGLMRARKEAKRTRRQAWKRTSMFHQKRGAERDSLPVMTAERLGLAQAIDATSQETPLHSIYVNVTYEGVPVDIWAEESEKVQRRVLTSNLTTGGAGRGGGGASSNPFAIAANSAKNGGKSAWDEKPLISTKFLLKYRATDPLVPLVSRASREVLQERPGETLLLFVDTPDGKVQVLHNEDLLFAFEQHASRGTLSPIELTVAKRKPPSSMTFLIAALTIGGTLSRIGLAFHRMDSHLEERVRLIGVLLIACLTMQLASNTLWYVYLLHTMSKKDLEFHMWRQVSVSEERIGFLFSIFGIANLEILGCQKKFGAHESGLRFTAPFNPELLAYLRNATIWSFVFSDFFPLVILWVETVLRQSYDDVVLWFTTVFGVLSILAILRRHQLLTLLTNVKPQGNRKTGPFAGKSRGTAALSRKEATVVKLRLAHYDALLSTLDMHHVDTLCEAIYSIVSPLVRSAGGILVRADGLCFTVIFNAASNTSHHAAAAFSFVSLVSLAIKKHMSPLLAIHAQRYWQLRKEEVPQNVLAEYNARYHRVVAGIVTAEMSVGYSGTASLRTYQHADWTHQFASALADLAEHYGSEILVNDKCATQLTLASEPTGVLARRPALVRQIDLCGLALLDPELCRLLSEQSASEYPRALKKEKVFEALGRGLPIHNTWKIPRELQAVYNSAFNYPYDDACAALILAYAKVNGGFEAAGSQQQSAAAVKLMETAAVKLSISKFDNAMEQIFVVQEPRILQQYCKEFPLDEVAHRVLRWAKFFGSPNQSEGIMYPRLISGMGVQPHPCELLHGVGSQSTTHAHAQQRKTARFMNKNFYGAQQQQGHDDNNASLHQQQQQLDSSTSHNNNNDDVLFHEALQESRRYFDLAPLVRPPRSERRQLNEQRRRNTANNRVDLIDYVLDRKQFSLSFVDREEDEPVHEL